MQRAKGKGQRAKVWWLPKAASKPFTFYLPPFIYARKRAGFTMVEMVVMISMIILISGIVLASFPSLSQRINLQRSSQKLALSLRKSQNMAFAVRQVSTPGGRIIPPAYGLYFNRATPNSYIIFADLKGSSGINDGFYRPSDDVVVETVELGPDISLGELISDLGGANRREEVLNIVFSVPEARMTISNASFAVGESAEVFINARTPNFTRSIVVRTTGQIYAK